jgi:hypothetical protein
MYTQVFLTLVPTFYSPVSILLLLPFLIRIPKSVTVYNIYIYINDNKKYIKERKKPKENEENLKDNVYIYIYS